MDFDKVVDNRHSARTFKDKKVGWKDVMDAVEAASKGSFAGNTNNQKFIIIEDKETINKVATHCHQTWITEAYLVVVICADDSWLEKSYSERGRIYSKQQAGAAINTFQLKLTDLGIDSCWVGAYDDDKLRDLLSIPEHINIEAVIPIGYEDKKRVIKKEKTRKKELDKVIFWEAWDKDRRPTYHQEAPLNKNPWE